MFKHLFGRGKTRSRRHGIASSEKPEAYWVARGEDVIGKDSLEEFREGRQGDTYQALVRLAKERAGGSVLDLGCNVAALGRLLYEANYDGRYTGVDSNPHGLAVARQALAAQGARVRLEEANIRQLPFADREFPLVVMKDVLEHMEDFRPLCAEAARVAGRTLLVANFIPWTEGDAIVHREPAGYYHNMYKRAEVYAFVRELGFEVERVVSALEKKGRANEIVMFVRRGA